MWGAKSLHVLLATVKGKVKKASILFIEKCPIMYHIFVLNFLFDTVHKV